MARSEVAYSVDEALAIADKLGYPVVLRPAYTMGGAGGGLVYNKEELKTVCARGSAGEPRGSGSGRRVHSWLGRAGAGSCPRCRQGNMITVCFIENIDPVGCAYRRFFLFRTDADDFRGVYRRRLQEQAYKIVEC